MAPEIGGLVEKQTNKHPGSRLLSPLSHSSHSLSTRANLGRALDLRGPLAQGQETGTKVPGQMAGSRAWNAQLPGRPRPASSPAPHPRRPPPRELRASAHESPCRAGFSVPAHPHLPRRAASRKAKLVASKGKNDSSEGSRTLEKHLQGVLWALCAKPGRHSSGEDEDGHGRGHEVGGRRSLARDRRAAGQVRRELDPSIVVTRRGHLQYERAILDW
ncbi:uncharacterized protein LOC122454159 [Cervus canadensis]|uniref:uncharacterized protein LOC122454159 n=1 Tax=Cervus canadensis TaxID=1574408 RepID=UPI001C9E61F2|nr:uncharacterized protein LOC122454159 [Cervus canadensis]